MLEAVNKHFQLVRCAPPAPASTYAKKLRHYLLCGYHMGKDMAKHDQGISVRGFETYAQAVDSFFEFHSDKSLGQHFTESRKVDIDGAKQGMVKSLLLVLLPCQPPAPNAGKWTKLFGSLDFFATGDYVGALTALSASA